MKRLLAGLVLAFGAALSHAATLVPIQLLNPAGSTSGQVLSSAGPSAVPTWTTITLSGLGGVTSAQAAAAAPVQSVAGRTGAVTLAVGDVSGAAPLASPTFTGTVTIPTGASITKPNIIGTATNDNASTGSVGEYASNTATAVSMTSGTPVTCTSVALSAGDWDVSGVTAFVPAGTTVVQAASNSINTVAATFGSLGANTNYIGSTTAGTAFTVPTAVVRISLASAGTAYLVVNGNFTTSTMTSNCAIRARRVR